MLINPDYINLVLESELDKAKGIFFGFLIFYRKSFPELEEYILDDHILPYEEFQIYQINLCKLNVNTGEMELKVPFFSHEEKGEFEDFLELLKTYHINSLGHLNNQLSYSIFGTEDKSAFFELKAKLKDHYNPETLAKVISEYYRNTQYASKLHKYLSTGAHQDYP